MVCQHAYSCEYEAHGEKRGSKLTAAALEPTDDDEPDDD